MKLTKWHALALLGSSLILLSFQNCAQPNLNCSDSDSTNCNSESTSSSSSSSSTTKNSGTKFTPPSSSAISSGGSGSQNGFGPGGSSSSGGTSSAGFGPGSGSSGNSGGLFDENFNTQDQSFRFVTPPKSIIVNEGDDFTLNAKVYGGKAPYKYQWYKDDAPIQNGLGIAYFYSDKADRWSKEGRYHLVVKDSGGQVITSVKVSVSFREVAGGCEAGTYYLLKSVDGINASMNDLFHNARGKWAISAKINEVGYWASYPAIADRYLQGLTNNQNLTYLGTMNISCHSALAYIHQPTRNPGAEKYWNAYEDGNGYVYSGAVTFECRNNKFIFKANTCQWVSVTPPDTDEDTSRNGGRDR